MNIHILVAGRSIFVSIAFEFVVVLNTKVGPSS